MNGASNKRRFELESLEPRCLLSGAALIAVATPLTSHALLMVAEEQLPSSSVEQALSETAYDAVAQAGSILPAGQTMALSAAASESASAMPAPGSPTESVPAESAPDATVPDAQLPAVTVTVSGPLSSPISSFPDLNADAATGVAQVVGSSTTERLTTTLKAANGPPSGQNDSPTVANLSSFSQGPDDRTVIQIGGTAGPGVEPNGWTQINVSGLAQLDGTLKIQLDSGFVPEAGQKFKVITWGTRVGEFANWLGTTGIPGHPDYYFKPIYSANDLTLEVIEDPDILAAAKTAIQNGLNTLGQIGNLLNNVGSFAQNIPFIGDKLSSFINSGSAITNAVAQQIQGFFASAPNIAEAAVTSFIQSWDNTSVGGFTIKVNGVLGHYDATGSGPFWWDLNLDIIPVALNRTLQNIAGAALGATFGSAPSVQVTSKLNLAMGFGYDAGFFLKLDHLTASANVNVSGLSGFPFNLAPPGGPLSLSVTNGTVTLSAAVTATPDSSVLTPNVTTGARISGSTLTTIASSATNVSNAFNLSKASSLDAVFTLNGNLTGFAVTFAGITTVEIHSADVLNGSTPDVTVVTNGSLTVLNQTLTGIFTFKKTATETDLLASNVALNITIGAGGSQKRVLQAVNGTGSFVLLGGDLAGTASLTIAQGPDIPGLTLSGSTLTLALNTSTGAVATVNEAAVNLPAGPYYRVSGHAVLGLATPQVNLAGDFVFEPRNTDGNPANGNEETVVGFANLSFAFSDGVNPLLNVTNGSGALVITSAGLYGLASANLSLVVPGISVTGVFRVLFNNTNAPIAARSVDANGTTVTLPALAAGPYVRVNATGATAGTHAQLTVLSVGVTGDFTFETKTTNAVHKVVTVSASNVSFNLGTVTVTNLLSITNGSGAFILTNAGLVGQGTVTLGINAQGISVGGAFGIQINQTGAAVNETVDVAGTPTTINLPGGPYLQVTGTGVTLGFLGVTLAGDFSFQQRTSTTNTQLVTVSASNLSFNFGTSILSASNGAGLFVINDSGIIGTAQIDVHVSAFGAGFSHTFTWDFNNTDPAIDQTFDVGGVQRRLNLPDGPFNRFSSGTPVSFSVDVGGHPQSFSAILVLSLVHPDSGSDYVTVGVSGLTTTLTAGPVSLAVAGGTGAFVIYPSTPSKLAGEVTVDTATLSGAVGVTLAASNLKLRINTTGADVGPVTVSVSDNAADNVTIHFTGAYYHDYFAVAGAADLTLAGFVTLGGNFSFEVSDADSTRFKVGVSDLHLDIKAGALTVASFNHGTGAFLIGSSGIAGKASLQFQTGILGMGGTISLEVNTANAPANGSVTINGTTTTINLTATHYLKVGVNGYLRVGSTSLNYNFYVVINGSAVEFWQTSPNALLVSISSTGAINLGSALSSLTNLDFAQPGPFEFVSMLRQLGVWFDAFRSSSVFSLEIPFTGGKTLGDAFDWSQLFVDKIYSHMVTVELQSTTVQFNQPVLTTGAFTFGLQLDTDAPISVTVGGIGPYGHASFTHSDIQAIATAINAALPAALTGRVTARENIAGQLVIALTDTEVAKGTKLGLVTADAPMALLGFGPADSNASTTEHVAVLTNRFTTPDFFAQLGSLLGLSVSYNAAQQVYTFDVDSSTFLPTTYSFQVPFTFNQDFGPIANAQLNGRLNISALVNFHFTLGFDLGAQEVPRVLSSSQVPVPANGRLSDDAHFQVYINGDLSPITLTLARINTAANTSIDELAAELNTLFATATYSGLGSPTPLNQLIIAQKAGTGLAISAKSTQLGVINRLAVVSLKNDTFATEMGFGMQLSPDGLFFLSAANSNIKGLFLDHVSLSASLTIAPDLTFNPNGISGSVRFGFIDISVPDGTFGTLDYSGNPSPLTATVSLQNHTTGATRLYIADLMNGTSSNNILNMVNGPNFAGSFLARLSHITVGGLGFSFPLGSNPTVSVFIPDIKNLSYNENPYNPATNNEGLFLSYPSLGSLQNFTSISFTQIIQALKVIADNLSQLSAFSFLDEKLPLVDLSVNDMIGYAAKFANLIDAASSGGSQTLQETITELKSQIDQVFHLNPNVLSIGLDDNGLTPASLISAGGDATHATTATLSPNGDSNNLVIRAAANGAGLNGTIVRLVGSSDVTGAGALATWDATGKVLTIKINGNSTTANAIISALAAIPGTPWTATLTATDNGKPNTGSGVMRTSSLRFGLSFSTTYANTLPFALDLKKLVEQLGGTNPGIQAFLDAATTLVQVQGSGQLTVSASASLNLYFGLDLTNPTSIKPFFYDVDPVSAKPTGVVLTARVLGEHLNVQASLGSILGIWIKDGSVTLDKDGDPSTGPTAGDKGAEFRLVLQDNNGDGRHYFDENWFNSGSIDLRMQGGVKAVLPIFAPLESMALGGTADNNHDGYADNDLVVDIPDLMRLFTDTRSTGNTSVLRIPGGNNDLTFTRSLGVGDYTVVVQQNGGLGTAAQASYSGNTLTIQINSGSTTAAAVKSAVLTLGSFTAAFTDPVGANDGAGTLTVAKLDLKAPDFSQLFNNISFCDVIANAAGPLLNGLDALLGKLQDGLNSVVSSTSLPLIGNGLSGAANFIQNFREGLLKELRDEVNAAGGNGVTAVENAIKKAFWNTLGPAGLNILVNPDSGAALDPSLGYSQLKVTLDCNTGLIVKLRLKSEIALVDTSGNPIKFDIGVPGFGLKGDGNVIVSLGFDLKFGFGVNKGDGFYFDSSAPASDPELQIYFRVTIPGIHFSGQLLFLQLDIADNSAAPSKFEGHFQVDLMDPNGDGKLTGAELTSGGTGIGDILHANLGADASVNLDLAASFGGNTAFPRVVAQFHLRWHFDIEHGAGDPQIYFDHVGLDVGTFISDFLGPILKEIQKVTEPIQPIIDIAQARIPILSDLAGQDVTFLTLAEVFGLLEPSTVDFINDVAQVITLVNKLQGVGQGDIIIPFGAFSLGSSNGGQMNQINPLGNLSNIDFAGAIQSASGPGVSSTYQSSSAGFAGSVNSLHNFSIPVFDHPSELFNLFIGKPVRLVEWRMPTFKFSFTYVQKIPIYPPLYAQFGGSIGADINIGFGYDTYGIQKFIEDPKKDPIDLLDGFYILTNDANGQPMPALKLTGEIFAGASIDLLMVEVGVRAGVSATISFFWNDNSDNDGKMRVSEIIANAKEDPRCVFNIEGEISLFLEAYLKIDLFFFSIDKTWRFATITLITFDLSCPEPVLGDLSGGVLTLNIGSRASLRLVDDTTDASETFVVRHVSGSAGDETVDVTWAQHRKQFEHVQLVKVDDAGKGDDVIDLRNVLCTVQVSGGTGDDTIYLSDGANSTADGGAGDDRIVASKTVAATGVVIHGGEGNDTITAGSVAITIYGDGGSDTIAGSVQADILYGGGGDDVIKGLDGNDQIAGDDGNDQIEAGEGNDFILGGAGDDVVNCGPGDDVVDAGGGNDLVYAGSGNDLLIGGNGNDRMFGDGGSDLLIGDKVTTVGGLAISFANLAGLNAAVGAIPTAGLSVQGIYGPDDSSTGSDFLVGGGGSDLMFGGNGDDFLYGGNFAANGDTAVVEEDGNDFMDGGPGNDVIFGDDSMGRTGDRNTGIAIKSSVWYDLNLNGLRDTEEKGLGGISVWLYFASSPPPLVGPSGNGTPITTTKTDVDGAFQFVGLDPNNYIVVFDLPTGLTFTNRGSGGVGASSADSDAVPTATATRARGQTEQFFIDYDQTYKAVSAGYRGNAMVSIGDSSVKEGNSGQAQMVFTVTLSGPQSSPVEVEYKTLDGTATAASGDYVPILHTQTLVFNPGETSKQIVLLVNSDTTYEAHEQFQLNVVRVQRMDASGATTLQLDHSPILGTILNDDPIPSISITDSNPGKDQTEGSPATFIVTLSNPSQYTITVNWRTNASLSFQGLPTEDAAVPAPFAYANFVMDQGTVTFQPGVTSKAITVKTLNNGLNQFDKTFFVDLSSPTYSTLLDDRGVGIIHDSNLLVSVSIVPVSPVGGTFQTEVPADPNSPQDVYFKVILSGNSGKKISVTWATSPGTAVEAVYSGSGVLPDYEGFPNSSTSDIQKTLVFNPGDPLSQIIKVKVNPANPSITTDRTFFVNLLSADNAVIAAAPTAESNHVTVVIKQPVVAATDVGPWSVFFGSSSYEIDEPVSGTATAYITIQRTPGSSQAIAVFYTQNGTATAGLDYASVFRRLVSFGASELSKTVAITVYHDALVEGDETVLLSLRNPTGGAVRAKPDTAVLTIHDGPNTPYLRIIPPTDVVVFGTPIQLGVEEGNAGVTIAKFTVTLLDPNTNSAIQAGPAGVTFQYTTVDLTAVAGVDYALGHGTVTIPYLSSSVTINISVFTNTVAQLDRTFAVRLSNASGATLAPANSVAVATIFDDDLTPISGRIFYDANGNGFNDLNEQGIPGVKVDVVYYKNGVAQAPVTTTTNSSGGYGVNVVLGQVTVTVHNDTVKSPYGLNGPGSSYTNTTKNENQVVQFNGLLGLPGFADIGYLIKTTSAVDKAATKDTGRGGTDDTIFGGPGNDTIDAGAGDDHVVGGHWMTATDGNVPINDGSTFNRYDAVVTATTTGLHVVYDNGPIFAVDTSGLNLGGKISGQIWLDANSNGRQDAGELFTGQDVVVSLYDCDGNVVNALVTNNGTYTFKDIFVQGTPSEYVVQFDLPKGFTFVSPVAAPASVNSDVVVGGRTTIVSLSSGSPAVADLDAGIRPAGVLPAVGPGSFQFSDPAYSVSEAVKGGILTITVIRGDSFEGRPVVVHTEDSTAVHDFNYTPVTALLYFAVGETIKTVDIPILNTHLLGICGDPLTFNLVLRDITGRPLDQATVYVGGPSYGSIEDNDTIQGGDDWDLILGDSGNIAATSVMNAFPTTPTGITYSAGPGNDTISGGGSQDFINGQLGNDTISGDGGRDLIYGDMGKDTIYVSLDDDQVDGGYGYDTVISSRDVARIELTSTGSTTATLVHRRSTGDVLSTFKLLNIELAQLFGGASDNVFDITSWNGSAFLVGAGGNDTLLVNNDINQKLRDATALEGLLYSLLYGFFKDSALSLPNGSTYSLSSLENVTLTGGPGSNTIDASGYSRPVTFVGLAGNDTLIGGSANDTFLFDADSVLGTDTITGNGGTDTLDFSTTTASVTVNLSTLAPTAQTVNGSLSLKLVDQIENLVGGSGSDTLTGNALSNVLEGGLGNDVLAGGAGNDFYPLDTDSPAGTKTIIENLADSGFDTIDFSGTLTQVINLSLSILGTSQTVNSNLTLTIVGEGVEQVIGGALDDVLRGNSNSNVLRGGLGNDLLDGKSGNDILDGGSGNNTLIGGLGTDTVSEQGNTNFTLTDTKLTRGTGQTEILDGIEIVNLTGGADANIFNLTGWTGGGSVSGGDLASAERADRLIISADANFTLTDSSLVISTNFGPIALSGIDIAVLTDGPGSHTLNAAGFSGTVTLIGNDGSDTLVGGSGINVLSGGLGNDQIIGGPGNNVVEGGPGSNSFALTLNAYLFVLTNTGLVADLTVAPGNESYTTLAHIQSVALTGGASSNRFDLTGWTVGSVSADGQAGTDWVVVQATTPGTITLTDTSVTFTGSSSTTTLNSIESAGLTGTSGNDVLDASGFSGTAVLQGGAGDDVLIAGPGSELLNGGAGNDRFVFRHYGALHSVFVVGGDGEDTLDFSAFTAQVGIDLSFLGSVQAVATGELGINLFSATEDVEDVVGSQGGGVFTGNSVNNVFTITGGNNNIDGGAGINMLVAAANSDFNLSNILLVLGATLNPLANIQVAKLTGGSGNNHIDATGFTGSVTLDGGAGDDTLIGGSGNDVLIGGAGDDYLRGNGGNDTYRFNADTALGQDTVDEIAGGGNDTLDFSATQTTGVTLDMSVPTIQTVAPNLKLSFTSSAGVENIIGTDKADKLTGNSLNNFFFGGRGDDDIDGGGGVNLVYYTADGDFVLTNTKLSIVDATGTQTVTIKNIQQGYLAGGAGANRMDASSFTLGSVYLVGEDGSDTLIGGYGDDVLSGGSGDDVLYGGGGSDTLYGNDGNDRLNGCGSIKTLIGPDGNDKLYGGDGNDTYIFDLSSTTLRPAVPQGTDTIFEVAGEGYLDAILGLGRGGVAVDLHSGVSQNFYDVNSNLVLVLVLSNPGQVEHGF